jgi:hypothetical protein
MHGDLDPDGVVDQWTLVEADWALIANKTGVSRLGFALSLKYFEAEACFPSGDACFDERVVRFVAEQLAVDRAGLAGYDWGGRTGLPRLAVSGWLGSECCRLGHDGFVFGWCQSAETLLASSLVVCPFDPGGDGDPQLVDPQDLDQLHRTSECHS